MAHLFTWLARIVVMETKKWPAVVETGETREEAKVVAEEVELSTNSEVHIPLVACFKSK